MLTLSGKYVGTNITRSTLGNSSFMLIFAQVGFRIRRNIFN